MPCPTPGPGLEYTLVSSADVRVTASTSNQSRSESVVGINPNNSQNMICASKKFIDRQKYRSTISTSFTFDGGQSWTESQLPLQPGWEGMTDPDLTFDLFGNAYLIVEPDTYPSLPFPDDVKAIGMYVLKSVDGGRTWSEPVQLHLDSTDDKQWITSDMSPTSPHRGAIYAVWAASSPLRFARSTDQGATWKGVGTRPSGSPVVTSEHAYAPSMCVDENGWIHIFWYINTNLEGKKPEPQKIRYTRSKDGGDHFDPPVSCVTDIISLDNALPKTKVWPPAPTDVWPHFDNATFRVLTLVTSCALGSRIFVAWADMRDGVSRIYYRMAANGGDTWLGPASGQRLSSGQPDRDHFSFGQPDQHHFHPQFSVAANGAVGCAFYEFGLKNNQYLIDVLVTYSCSDGDYFSAPIKVTDQPWDPATHAPLSHSNPNVTFIGEYFGFDASNNNFAVVWTDTRTGDQELFFDLASLIQRRIPVRLPGEVGTILAGIIADGGGLVMVDGVIIHLGPGDPMVDILNAIAAIDAVKRIQDAGARQALSSLRQIIANVVREERETERT